MKTWEMTYTENRQDYEVTIVTAPTYTMAVLAFTMKFPNGECTRAREIENGQEVFG